MVLQWIIAVVQNVFQPYTIVDDRVQNNAGSNVANMSTSTPVGNKTLQVLVSTWQQQYQHLNNGFS